MTRYVQDFIAADILVSRLVFITTGGPTVPTRALSLLPGSGTRYSTGTPIDSPSKEYTRSEGAFMQFWVRIEMYCTQIV